MIATTCAYCHYDVGYSRGAAADSRLLFRRYDNLSEEQQAGDYLHLLDLNNLAALDDLVAQTGMTYILNKVNGRARHGGGKVWDEDTYQYQLLSDYLAKTTGSNQALPEPPPARLESQALTLRRASLMLRGQIPSVARLNQAAQMTPAAFAEALRDLMQGPEFAEYLKRSANDQLLTRSLRVNFSLEEDMNNYYPWFPAGVLAAGEPSSQYDYVKAVMTELGEAPLEHIAQVVQSERPYTEILTAPYAMAGVNTAPIYQSDIWPTGDAVIPSLNKGQRLSANAVAVPSGNWLLARKLTIPSAGLLSELGFLQQFPTTATNRNRARAKWVYQLFLGVDIEGSAARILDSSTLADPSSAAQIEPACQICHQRLDPVAAAFQHFGARGMYNESAYGRDSLPDDYKATKNYQPRDTWYRTQPPAGFEGQVFDPAKDPLQQLASTLVQDPRFAEAAVKFWWPSLMAEKFTPGNLDDTARSYRAASLKSLSAAFKQDNYNLKTLLVQMLLSPWFRADLTQPNPYRQERRLLTPEELAAKTESLTGLRDERLTHEWNLVLGGIDSFNLVRRQRELSQMMLRAASRHVITNACSLVLDDLARPPEQRKLFAQVSWADVDDAQLAAQLVTLAERLWGDSLEPQSADIQSLVSLFRQLAASNLLRASAGSQETCRLPAPASEPATAPVTAPVTAQQQQAKLAAWRGLLISMMTDYRYLHE